MWSYGASEETKNVSIETSRAALETELAAVTKKLKEKQHVIVGHNLFTDLCFLYKTFIGTLPAGVGDFQKQVNSLFPTVVDTKFLATYGSDDMNPRVNLKELLVPVCITFSILHSQYPSLFG